MLTGTSFLQVGYSTEVPSNWKCRASCMEASQLRGLIRAVCSEMSWINKMIDAAGATSDLGGD